MSDDQTEIAPEQPADWKRYDQLMTRIGLTSGAILGVAGVGAILLPNLKYFFFSVDLLNALYVLYVAVRLRRRLARYPEELLNPRALEASIAGVWGSVSALGFAAVGLALKIQAKLIEALSAIAREMQELARVIERIVDHLASNDTQLPKLPEYVPDEVPAIFKMMSAAALFVSVGALGLFTYEVSRCINARLAKLEAAGSKKKR